MATFTVINTDDSGQGSLRQAIEDANATSGNDTIDFDELLREGTITLTSGELEIFDDLTINGLGADELTVSGNNASRVFLIDDSNESNQIEVAINNLTITEGSTTDNGGGIFNRENLTVANSTISDNTGDGISSSGGSFEVNNSTIFNNTGIGISASGGSFEVNNSTISNNTSAGIGVGFADLNVNSSNILDNEGTGISAGFAEININNSTISGNRDSGISPGRRSRFNVVHTTISDNTTIGNGGGISASTEAGISIINSTITNNTADIDGNGEGNGGGINLDGGGSAVNLRNTIVAGNFDNSPPENENHPDISGISGTAFISNGYNLIGDITGLIDFSFTSFPAPGDLFGTSEDPLDPLLGPLQDNGGSTFTQALLPGSPAIDAGDPDFEPLAEFDQRGAGFPRVLDGDGDGTATVDIGAFEFINIIDGTLGNDLLIGTPSSDRISGFNGNDLLIGGNSDDILDGDAGNDRLFGNDGHDSLLGGDGRDFLVGETGDDLLDGGADNDNLIGSSGTDRFVLRQGDGRDTIFDYLDGTDFFLLADGLAFEDLTITQGVGQSLISVTDTNEELVGLFGVNASELGAEDFSTLVEF